MVIQSVHTRKNIMKCVCCVCVCVCLHKVPLGSGKQIILQFPLAESGMTDTCLHETHFYFLCVCSVFLSLSLLWSFLLLAPLSLSLSVIVASVSNRWLEVVLAPGTFLSGSHTLIHMCTRTPTKKTEVTWRPLTITHTSFLFTPVAQWEWLHFHHDLLLFCYLEKS